MSPPQAPDPQDIRDTVDEILSRSEFQPDLLEKWTQDFFRWIGRFVDAFDDWARAHPAGSMVVMILLAAVGVLMVVLAIRFLRRLSSNKKTSSLSQSTSWKALEGRAQDWDSAIALARRSLLRGDLYQAVWIGHRLLLSLLDHRGLLSFAKWKTNSAYLQECGPGQARELLGDLSDIHDQVVYAHRTASAQRIERLLIQVDELQRNPSLSS